MATQPLEEVIDQIRVAQQRYLDADLAYRIQAEEAKRLRASLLLDRSHRSSHSTLREKEASASQDEDLQEAINKERELYHQAMLAKIEIEHLERTYQLLLEVFKRETNRVMNGAVT
ncbi:hypothetical protein [Thermoactinomyces sp. DSM 45892]|uniref:hypothetical protein n=1 Tax=Thermoactinomyces sp. DSM 45892 TaxID=1882753 RepID=UPI00089A3F1A|nr:hypothetical protein [Thermoactinomyces sp. DSM 45892]SDY87808.1 hypothetical protein SAMN05444416_109146 [Thermoactinomyces sp. DSM 45892]